MAFRELPVEFRTIEDDIVPYMLFREVLLETVAPTRSTA
jgi:hypothetical protein